MPILSRRRLYQPRACFDPQPSGGESTVLFDASAAGGHSTPSSTSYTTANTIDVGSGSNGTSNRMLLAFFLFGQAAAGTSVLTSVTYDPLSANQPMSAVPGRVSVVGAGDIAAYYLVAPATGSKLLSATWTGANQVETFLLSLVSVDQTGGTTTFPNVVATHGTSGVPTISVPTSPTTRLIVGGFSSTTNFTTSANTAFTGSPDNSQNTWATAAAFDSASAGSIAYSPASSIWNALGIAVKGA